MNAARARASGNPADTGQPAPEPADGVLPAAPRHPALHLVGALDDRDLLRGDRRVAGRAHHRAAHRWAPPVLLHVHPLHGASLRLPAARRPTPIRSSWATSGHSTRSISSFPTSRSPQPRWKTLVRLVIALPSLFVAAALGGAGGGATPRHRQELEQRRLPVERRQLGDVLPRVVRVRRDGADAEGLPGHRRLRRSATGRRSSRTCCSSTDRYPNADPTAMLSSVERPPVHPVHVVGDSEDLRMSRVTVFFRLPLVDPAPRLARALERARGSRLDRAVARHADPRPADRRRSTASSRAGSASRFHVYAFGALVANPFPSLRRAVRPLPARPRAPRARRARTAGRRSSAALLAIPAFLVSSALNVALVVDAVLTGSPRSRPGGARGAAQPVGLRAAVLRARRTRTRSS